MRLDPKEARRLLAGAEAMPVIPVYWYTNAFLIHPDVRNWNPRL